jgi:hypothetical protein
MRKNSLFLGVLFTGFAIAHSAFAASLYIDPATGSMARGDTITLSVRLDTNESEQECVNAVDGVIHFSENLTPVDVTVADSIFSMWVEQPKIDKNNHTVSFAGGIPNGYCGRIQGDPRLTNTIVKLIFRLPGFSVGSGGITASSSGTVEFGPETTAYLNDGQGTKAELATYGATIALSDKPGTEVHDDWQLAIDADNIPPEQFSIDLQKNDTSFDGKYFIVFNTTDKQTGVDEYQVMEEPVSRLFDFNWGRADAPWITARSPYQLKDQSLNSTIRVKAVDKAGNEYVATLVPDKNMRGISTRDILVGGGILLAFLLVIGGIFGLVHILRKRRKSRASE